MLEGRRLCRRTLSRLPYSLEYMSWEAVLQSHRTIYTSGEKIRLYRVTTENAYGEGVIVKQTQCESEAEAAKAENEGKIAQCHPHPNLCECLGWEREPIPGGEGFFVYSFWEPIPESLQEEIEWRSFGGKGDYYTEEELWRAYGQLLDVLSYLQERGIAHRDIKPDNIMRDKRGNSRLCDFGFAKECSDSSPLNTLLGSPRYMSPALLTALIGREDNEKTVIAHNPYKSDVYSLGLVLLHMSSLELYKILMQLDGLQRHIDELLDGLRKQYSEKWIDLLRWMLRVEEKHRPDFLQLQMHLNHPFLYDDEYLDISASVIDLKEPLQFFIRSGLSSVRVSSQQVDEVPCMVTIRAPALNSNQRVYAMDLVCVIDQSGSMMDENLLKFVKFALTNILDKLNDQDRFSLVGFSDKAEIKCPLIRCTPQGKERIINKIIRLNVLDLTNLTAGFLLGLRVLKNRRYHNQASSLLLFTDGKHNIGDSPFPLCEQEMANSGLEHFRVCCFGFGDNVERQLLETLAHKSRGKYYHLNHIEEIVPAFALALGNLNAVIARNLEVDLEALDSNVPCDITKIYSMDGTNRFTLSSLSNSQEINLIFLLKPRYQKLHEDQRCQTIKAQLKYIDNEGTNSSKLAILDVKFVKFGVAPYKDTEIFENWNRIREMDSLQQAKQLAKEEKFDKSQAYILQGIDGLNASEYHEYQEVVEILPELRHSSETFRDEESLQSRSTNASRTIRSDIFIYDSAKQFKGVQDWRPLNPF